MVSSTSVRQKVAVNSVQYPVSWYPICLSSELKSRKTLNIRAFGRQWVAFRNEDCKPFVFQRYCPHMGVDLSRGSVDSSLTCPLHNRKFPESSCSEKRDGLPIELPVCEKSGMVFVLLGENENLPFPGEIYSGCESFIATYNYPAPFQMVGLNGFDIHHLDIVHGRSLSEPAIVKVEGEIEISINYKASISGKNFRDRFLRFLKIDSVDICIHSFGNSILLFDHKKIGAQTLLCLQPVEKNKTRIFLRTILINKSWSILNRLKTHLIQKSIIKFLKQDFHPLWNSRFMPEGMTEAEDKFALQWKRHYEKMPKISVPIEDA